MTVPTFIQSLSEHENSSTTMLTEIGNNSSTAEAATLSIIDESTTTEAATNSINSSSNMVLELNAFEAARLGYFRHSPLVSVIITIAYTIIFVIGIVGNSFVVAIVCKSPRMRTVTNYFIANLALADILVLVFCLPATLMGNLFIPYVLGLFVCKTVSYLQGVAVGASINTMVTVTLDRFLAICFPMDWHMSRRTARWVIACIWLFSGIVTAPWAVYFTLAPYPHEGAYIQVCSEEWPNERMGAIYFVCANLILEYLFPATVIILCYLGIWYKIERRNIPGDRPKGLKIELIMQKSKLKVIKMMMFVVVIFLLSWTPLYLIFTRIKFSKPGELGPTEEWLMAKVMPLAQWLGASNSCINPILYTLFNRKYKRGFFDLFRFAFCCDPSMKYERQAQSKVMAATNGTEFVRLDGGTNNNSITTWNSNAQNSNQNHGAVAAGKQSISDSRKSSLATNANNNGHRFSGGGGERSKNCNNKRQIGFRVGEQSTATITPGRCQAPTRLAGKRQQPQPQHQIHLFEPARHLQDSKQVDRGDTTSSASSNYNGAPSGASSTRLTSRRLSAGLPSLGNNSSMATTTTTIEEEDQSGQALFNIGHVSLYQSNSNVATTSIDCDDVDSHDDDERQSRQVVEDDDDDDDEYLSRIETKSGSLERKTPTAQLRASDLKKYDCLADSEADKQLVGKREEEAKAQQQRINITTKSNYVVGDERKQQQRKPKRKQQRDSRHNCEPLNYYQPKMDDYLDGADRTTGDGGDCENNDNNNNNNKGLPGTNREITSSHRQKKAKHRQAAAIAASSCLEMSKNNKSPRRHPMSCKHAAQSDSMLMTDYNDDEEERRRRQQHENEVKSRRTNDRVTNGSPATKAADKQQRRRRGRRKGERLGHRQQSSSDKVLATDEEGTASKDDIKDQTQESHGTSDDRTRTGREKGNGKTRIPNNNNNNKARRLPFNVDDDDDDQEESLSFRSSDDEDEVDLSPSSLPNVERRRFDIESGLVASGTSLACLFLKSLDRNNANNNSVYINSEKNSTQSQKQLANSGNHQTSLLFTSGDGHHDESSTLTTSKSCVDLSKRRGNNNNNAADNVRAPVLASQQHY